jgi:tetratricopeptide (TPR) repeat protein
VAAGPDRDSAVTVPLPSRSGPAAKVAWTGQGSGAQLTAVDCASRMTADAAAGEALSLRDQALAELDAGDPSGALGIARQGLAVLQAAGLRGGADEAAMLIALAEIEEALGCFGDAGVTIAAAIVTLEDDELEDEDDKLILWCQAQERQAGLERTAGDFDVAASRLRLVLDRASAALGEASRAVVSAANSLGVVYKYASDFDAAESAYRRAAAAAQGLADPDPLIEAGLLHNLAGLAHSRGAAAAGIPLAERGATLRAEVLGPDHPDVARDLNALGALYHLDGRLGEAAQAYRRALAVFEDRYGPDHFEVAMTCANLAVLHADEGDFAQAETLGGRSLRILETVLGPDDAEVGLTLLNQAAAVAGQGRMTEATALASRSATILAARLPAGHPHLAAATEAAEHYRRSA